MVNKTTKLQMRDKFAESEFGVTDVPAYLALFCAIGNETPDVQDEVAAWDRTIQFDLAGGEPYWMVVKGSHFEAGPGLIGAPDLTLHLSAQEAARMFCGEKDAKASYQTGALQIDGAIPDALRLQFVLGIVNEEIEYP